MNREFQVIYREMRGPNFIEPMTGPQTVTVIFQDAKEVEAAFKQDTSLRVISVKEVRPIVDWEKPVWDLDEFAAALTMKGGSLSSKKGDGKIPWNSAIGGVPRRVAMKWFEHDLNEAGKKIVRELEEAA